MYKKIKIYDYNDPQLYLDIHVDNFEKFTFLNISNSFTSVKDLTAGVVKGIEDGITSAIGGKYKIAKGNSIQAKDNAKGILKNVSNLYGGSENITFGGTGSITKNYYTGSTINFPLFFSFTLLSDDKYSAIEKFDLLMYWSLPKSNLKNKVDGTKSKQLDSINSVIKGGSDIVTGISNRLGEMFGADKDEIEFFNWGASWLGVKIDDVLTLDKPPIVISNMNADISFESTDRYNNPQSIKVDLTLEFLQVPTQSEYLSFFNIVSDLGLLQESVIEKTKEEIELDFENTDMYVNCEEALSGSITNGESGE